MVLCALGWSERGGAGAIENPRPVVGEVAVGGSNVPLRGTPQPWEAGASRLLADSAAAQAPPAGGSQFLVGVLVGATCGFLLLVVPLVGFLIWRFKPKPKVVPDGGAGDKGPGTEEAPASEKPYEAPPPPGKPLGRGRLDPILSAKEVAGFGSDGHVIYKEEEEESQEPAAGPRPSLSSVTEEPAGNESLDPAASSGTPATEVLSTSEASVVGASPEVSPGDIGGDETLEDSAKETTVPKESSIEEMSAPEIEEEVRKPIGSSISWKSKKQVS